MGRGYGLRAADRDPEVPATVAERITGELQQKGDSLMKFRRKTAGVAVAVASLTALAACSSSSSHSSTTTTTTPGSVTVPGAIGSVPLAAANGPKHAGTITWSELPNAVPNWIFPLVPSASNSVYNNFTFIWEMWRPLVWTVYGTDPEPYWPMSIINPPSYSNGGKTVTISLKSSYTWSNGQPITANDVMFYIDLAKAADKESPADWEGYVPGHFPDNLVSTAQPNTSTLVMNLSGPVNPTWFTDNYLGQGPIIALPSGVWAKESATGAIIPPSGWTPATMEKIYNYLITQAKSLSTYATNPLWQVVDGPYKLSAYNGTTGGFTMVPNATYGGPHVTPMSDFQGVPFTSDTAMFNALRAGAIDVADVPYEDIPQLPAVQRLGDSYLGEPDYGMNFANYNFKDTTGDFNNIINQLYMRQALAHLVDDQGWITAFMHGAGAPSYGPIPAYPQSPYLPADAATNPYPFSISSAISILKAHGWTVNPGGTDVCSSPGAGPANCGAGIPAGTKLAWNYIYTTTPALIGDQATDFVSKARQAGIQITLSSSNFNYMIANYLDPSAPANENKWAMEDFGGETEDPYATTFGLFNTGGPEQVGDYSNPTADALINASISGGNPAAVKNEASFLTANQPVQFQPVPDIVWAWKNTLSAVNPQAWENLTQYYATPEFWYFN
jgi:peptide/nickel transport system substrate-binding protein